MPPLNFVVTDRETYAIIEKIEDKETIRSVLISNEPEYLNYFQFIFDELWKDGVDAKVRIDNIEQNTDFGHIEVIPSSSRAADLYLKFIRKAQKEIMIMFPTANAFLRQYNMGALKLAVEAAHRDVKVRVLMPNHKSTEQLVDRMTAGNSVSNSHYTSNFNVRYIEQTLLDTHATILVVDKKHSLVMEIRNDLMGTFEEAIGLSTYSNSKAGVLSYLSLVEHLWAQSEIHQQIKESYQIGRSKYST